MRFNLMVPGKRLGSDADSSHDATLWPRFRRYKQVHKYPAIPQNNLPIIYHYMRKLGNILAVRVKLTTTKTYAPSFMHLADVDPAHSLSHSVCPFCSHPPSPGHCAPSPPNSRILRHYNTPFTSTSAHATLIPNASTISSQPSSHPRDT